jgi:hypothetical protein
MSGSASTWRRIPETDEWECFDLEADPQELVSVYEAPEYASVVAGLKEELATLRQKYGDA